MYDFKKAFTFMKEDRDWGKKFFIGGILTMVPVLIGIFIQMIPDDDKKLVLSLMPEILAGLFVLCIFSLILAGYYYEVIHTKLVKKSDILPDWKRIGHYWFTGFKAGIGQICLLVITLIPVLTVGLCGWGVLKAIPEAAKTAGLTAVLAVFVIIAILSILTFFIWIMAAILMNISFAYDFKISSYLNFKRGMHLLKGNIINFIILTAMLMAISSIAQTMSLILQLTVIGIFAVPFLIYYIMIVSADFSAQFGLNSQYEKSLTNDCNCEPVQE